MVCLKTIWRLIRCQALIGATGPLEVALDILSLFLGASLQWEAGQEHVCVCVGGMEWEGNIVVGHGRWLLEDKETGRVPELSSFKTPMQRPSGNQEMSE